MGGLNRVDQLAAWWRGPGWTTHDVVADLRPGGRFSAKQQSPDGELDLPFDGFYREIVPAERLVVTLSDADDPTRASARR